MLVFDTSALISLGVGDVLDPVLDELSVATTALVWAELEETSGYDDRHGRAARAVLECEPRLELVDVTGEAFVTSRIDAGEASCVAAVRTLDAPFLITDDFRALPELQRLVDAEVALSPIVLRALVKRGALSENEARTAFDAIAEGRDWLGAPIYRYARRLFD
ncbi:hypothetical protein [Natronomonas sp. EA1]|uniref:hypothetical protein n=1 Tax=Natronomonas sp. EA1 TaxID=3421655 RepID=UPI003EB9E072